MRRSASTSAAAGQTLTPYDRAIILDSALQALGAAARAVAAHAAADLDVPRVVEQVITRTWNIAMTVKRIDEVDLGLLLIAHRAVSLTTALLTQLLDSETPVAPVDLSSRASCLFGVLARINTFAEKKEYRRGNALGRDETDLADIHTDLVKASGILQLPPQRDLSVPPRLGCLPRCSCAPCARGRLHQWHDARAHVTDLAAHGGRCTACCACFSCARLVLAESQFSAAPVRSAMQTLVLAARALSAAAFPGSGSGRTVAEVGDSATELVRMNLWIWHNVNTKRIEMLKDRAALRVLTHISTSITTTVVISLIEKQSARNARSLEHVPFLIDTLEMISHTFLKEEAERMIWHPRCASKLDQVLKLFMIPPVSEVFSEQHQRPIAAMRAALRDLELSSEPFELASPPGLRYPVLPSSGLNMADRSAETNALSSRLTDVPLLTLPHTLGFLQPLMRPAQRTLVLANRYTNVIAFAISGSSEHFMIQPIEGHVYPGQLVEVQITMPLAQEPSLQSTCQAKLAVETSFLSHGSEGPVFHQSQSSNSVTVGNIAITMLV